MIDESGRYLGEEYTVAMIAEHVLRQRKGPLVTNCSTSRMTEDLAVRHGQPFFRSAVGEANVVDMMLAKDAIFGGEGNGGPIDPRVGLVRDSFVGMAQLLDAMAARELPISRLADELPRYEIVKTKVTMPPEKVAAALHALEKHFDDARPDRLDGLRLDWPRAVAAGPAEQHRADRPRGGRGPGRARGDPSVRRSDRCARAAIEWVEAAKVRGVPQTRLLPNHGRAQGSPWPGHARRVHPILPILELSRFRPPLVGYYSAFEN